MKRFAALIKVLDSTNKTTLKVAALTQYFKEAPEDDKLWTIALLSSKRPKRPVNTTLLRQWATEISGIPLWLFEESYTIVGDLAETIALILPTSKEGTDKSLTTYIEEVIELRKMTSDYDKKAYLHDNWLKLDYYERFVFNKILTSSFRIGVSRKLMTRALAAATDQDESVLAHKLMGNWTPADTTFDELVYGDDDVAMLSKPYPFYLAYGIEDNRVEDLGDVTQWSFEHKWDGIRSQTIIRNDEIFIWSRGEELVTDKYPELHCFVGSIPNGTVIDGELLPFKDGQILNFNDLQTRIGRKNVSKAMLEKTPVAIAAYDLLEWEGKDIRQLPFTERRALLDKLVLDCHDCDIPLMLSETLEFNNWEHVAAERERSREKHSEGLMIKRKDSPYLVGRKKGDWWKWKVDPLSVDAVLTYAMRGSGRRANLYTDYTFGLWKEGELVTFAKAYSGLTDAEFRKVDNWIRKNTLERYGPVRSVNPELVFEIAFEGIAKSTRHKSGYATRFPRIIRWRHDKPIEEANTIEDLQALVVN